MKGGQANRAFEGDLPSYGGTSDRIHQNGGRGNTYTVTKDADITPDTEGLETCGIGPFVRLRCLRVFTRVEWFVAVLCMFCFVEGASINGLVSISLSTIEKRFQFKSSESGLILSSADIGATALVLFVSYYGDKGHKPRVIGAGCLLMAVGSFLLVLPHILVGEYRYSTDDNDIGHVCDADRADPCSVTSSGDPEAWSSYLPLFAAGQGLQGIGFTPAFTVGAAYLDDNTEPEKTALYMGVIYALTALGVAVGYIVGGQVLNVWIDVGRVDTDSIPIDPSDSRWLGAWWMGFIVTTCLYLILTLPLASFPRRMPDRPAVVESKPRNSLQGENDEDSLCARIFSFPNAILELLKNPVFVMIVLVGSMESLLFTGLGAFAAKILEEKFDVHSDDAGLIMGAVTLVGGAGGMVLGGALVKRHRLTVGGIVTMCLVLAAMALVLGGGFFLNCPEAKFAGLTSVYRDYNSSTSHARLSSDCNSGCRCLTQGFDPVCGSDNVTYFSACHAGCGPNVTIEGLTRTYTNCSCVDDLLLLTSSTPTPLSVTSPTPLSPTATNGECPNNCPHLYIFVALLFLALLATFTTVTPLSIAIMRCVPEDKRSLGLGVQWVCLRLLGTIPGPILTGFVLDKSCDLWEATCQGQGTCWVYDRYTMSWSLFAWWVAVKAFTTVVLGVVSLVCRRHTQTTRPSSPGRLHGGTGRGGDSAVIGYDVTTAKK